MVSGAATVYAGEEEAMEASMITLAEGLTSVVIPVTDEELEAYIENGDPFTVSAMTSWASAKKELGEKTEEDAGDTEVTLANKQYTVTVPQAFEKADANFVYVFDEKGTPVSMTVDVQYPLSVTLQRAGLNTLMGIGTVFLMLIFLSFVIYLFKFIPVLLGGKKKEAPAQAAAPVAVAAPVVEETVDDGELIAVIAAAIAASEGTSTDDFVVRSIRKVKRSRR